jgi:hypothetical protein
MSEIGVALISALLGIIGSYFAARQKFRDDLQAKYDESLRNDRLAAYKELWALTKTLPLYARTEPVTGNTLWEMAIALRNWYFDKGGIFLTDNSRDAYFDLQKKIKSVVEDPQADLTRELDGPTFKAVRELSSNLRTNLSSDLRSRKQPEFGDLEDKVS